jgi:hypothetical protein
VMPQSGGKGSHRAAAVPAAISGLQAAVVPPAAPAAAAAVVAAATAASRAAGLALTDGGANVWNSAV